ncbi:outer membrane protein assembly factor BamB family protein [Halorientalis marina]|uniref:outer membrane protein assembly factor BamB family protein n=1 Tax=Halorientalis marina TaxID=2931976 RepID=UPI001FF2B3F5|nr:PQQ-binding-like beta-propeller repeat protein [Halorientalis marina]
MPGPGSDRGAGEDPKRESTTPYQGIPRPTRRTLLDGIAGVGALAVIAPLVDRIGLGPISTAAPPPDAWPLRRYDPAGTAGNPDATPPSDPAVDWVDHSLSAARTTSVRLVAGPDAVYASATETVALDRADGSERWRVAEPGGRLALHGDTLYVASGSLGTLRALGTDGSKRWTSDIRSGAGSLVVADGTVFVGGGSGVYAYTADSGSRKWTDGDDWADQVRVGDGRLLTSHGDLTKYRQRSVLDVPLGSPPAVDWTVTPDPNAMAATDAGPVVGRNRVDDRAALLALDGAGQVRWRAVTSPDGQFVAAAPLAVAGDRCFVALVNGDESSANAVASHALADGARHWRRPVEGVVTDIAVVGDSVLIGTRPLDDAPIEAAGTVRAFARADGSERWRVALDAGCRQFAPVDGAVFVVTDDQRVVAIR